MTFDVAEMVEQGLEIPPTFTDAMFYQVGDTPTLHGSPTCHGDLPHPSTAMLVKVRLGEATAVCVNCWYSAFPGIDNQGNPHLAHRNFTMGIWTATTLMQAQERHGEYVPSTLTDRIVWLRNEIDMLQDPDEHHEITEAWRERILQDLRCELQEKLDTYPRDTIRAELLVWCANERPLDPHLYLDFEQARAIYTPAQAHEVVAALAEAHRDHADAPQELQEAFREILISEGTWDWEGLRPFGFVPQGVPRVGELLESYLLREWQENILLVVPQMVESWDKMRRGIGTHLLVVPHHHFEHIYHPSEDDTRLQEISEAWRHGQKGLDVVLRVPRLVHDTLLDILGGGRRPEDIISVALHEDDTSTVLETALELWDPHSTGTLDDLGRALEAARRL